MTLIENQEVDLIINIPRRHAPSRHRTDGYRIRRLAIDHNIPLITNLQVARAFLQCLIEPGSARAPVKSWQEYTT